MKLIKDGHEGVPHVIDHLLAYVAIDDDGDEGVVAYNTPSQGWMPLVGADMERMNSLRPYAQSIANETGKRIELVKFATRIKVDDINPRG